MRGYRALVQGLLGLTVSIGLASCAVSDPTQYYTLDPATRGRADPRAHASIMESSAAGGMGIGIGPVILPGYLDRIQVVTRTNADQVDISVYHRWAESLDEGIARILAEEVGARVPTERIVMYPWRGVVAREIQYQVVVVVMRFDGSSGGDVTLDARWRVLGRGGDELAFKRSAIVEHTEGPGYAPLVAAMGRVLVTLGQEIAAEIQAIPH